MSWPPPHLALFVAYLLIGPGLAALFVLGLVVSRTRFVKLKTRTFPLPEPLPKVAILIPAHNEGAGIQACLQSVLSLRYGSAAGPLKVIAVDDRSTDNTLARMRQVESSDPRLSVLAVTSKPDDWLGKCHALLVASQHPWAREADYLLFIDSDVLVQPTALEVTLAQATARKVDALSILTRQRCDTFLEKLLTPLACGVILSMYFASGTNQDNRPQTAFANGQFFLIRRSTYDQVGGHFSVRNMPTEDVDLMRVLKRSGARCRLYAGDHLAETRMYDSLSRMLSGWARIYSGASHRRPWRILLTIPVLLSFLLAFIAPFLSAHPAWQAAGGAHLLTVLTILACVYRWSGNSPFLALLYPLALPFQLALFAKALTWCATNRMVWRGTGYTAPTAGPTDRHLTPPTDRPVTPHLKPHTPSSASSAPAGTPPPPGASAAPPAATPGTRP